jgi:hypothetical protein
MKNRFSNLFASRKSSFLPFQPSNRRIKVSLHQLINDLLAGSRNGIIHNGVPQGLCFIAQENLLAYKLWNLLGNALRTRQDEPIHVLALVDDHQTTISVKNAAHNFAISIPNTRLAR